MVGNTETRVIYNGNGVATEYPYEFKIIDKDNIKLVLVDAEGNETLLVNDYYINTEKAVVVYPGYPPGAEVPEAEKPPLLQPGEKLVIYRDVPITQLSKLPSQHPWNINESALDKLTLIAQELADGVDRSMRLSEAADFNTKLIVPVAKGKSFRWNDDGTGLQVTDDPAEVKAYADAAVATAQGYAEQTENAFTEGTAYIDAVKAATEGYKDTAVASAAAAATSEGNAEDYATNALESAVKAQAWAESDTATVAGSKSAKTWATEASASAGSAATSAATATSKATAAATSATTASTKASEASASATKAQAWAESSTAPATGSKSAKTWAEEAKASATTASTKASEASTSASNALSYRNTASTYATNASNSATAAAQSAQQCANLVSSVGNPVGSVNGVAPDDSGNVTLPTITIAQGGTGATTVAGARKNLGLGNTSGALPVANGGTGATTASGALTNLGLTATATELNVLDGITATTAELNYTDGVTSNIQTQLNGKAPSSHSHSTSDITGLPNPVVNIEGSGGIATFTKADGTTGSFATGKVLSVNGTEPDSSGNVAITVGSRLKRW